MYLILIDITHHPDRSLATTLAFFTPSLIQQVLERGPRPRSGTVPLRGEHVAVSVIQQRLQIGLLRRTLDDKVDDLTRLLDARSPRTSAPVLPRTLALATHNSPSDPRDTADAAGHVEAQKIGVLPDPDIREV